MRLKPHVSSLALLTAVLATTLPAAAQQTTLDTLRITAAGLTPFEEQEIGRSYTVIDGDAIQLSGTAYVADVLRQVPGFAVSRGGSFGGLTDVRVRGAEANHVLVLIDGVPVNENSSGGFDFGRLAVANIERIEILRGPQSAFWGANAVAGVINIVTKSANSPGLSGSLAGELGSDGTKMTSGSLAYAQDNFASSGSLTFRNTDGFNVSTVGTELDAATHIDANARFSADITPHLKLDGTVRYGRVRADADDFGGGIMVDSPGKIEADEVFGGLGLSWVSEDGLWFQNARVSVGKIDRNSFDLTYDDINTSTRQKASYQIGRNFDTPGFMEAKHTVTIGYDLVHETFQRLNSPSIFDPSMLELKQRTTQSLIGEYRGTYYDQLYLTAAVRHDFNDNFADVTTYSASAAWQVPNTGTKLHASLGTGSANPTFFEQFGYIPGQFTPNPNLIPETSFGWDIGVEQALMDGVVVVDATYFNQTLENEIAELGFMPSTVVNQAGTSTRQGIEVSASVNVLNGLTIGASYTYLDAFDALGVREVRRPQHSGSINLAYKLEEIPLTLHGEVVFAGDATDTAKRVLPAYAVVNGGLNYQLSEQVEVYGRVQNLFDTKYQEVYGYNTQGRTFYAGARAKF
ncbi:TonB-dependent receptor plug domain-containing protein [Devosia riboflavina]